MVESVPISWHSSLQHHSVTPPSSWNRTLQHHTPNSHAPSPGQGHIPLESFTPLFSLDLVPLSSHPTSSLSLFFSLLSFFSFRLRIPLLRQGNVLYLSVYRHWKARILIHTMQYPRLCLFAARYFFNSVYLLETGNQVFWPLSRSLHNRYNIFL